MTDASMLRRGRRLLWRNVRPHLGPFALSIFGSTLFAAMTVAGTIVIGRITDDVVLPAFETGVEGDAVVGAVLALLGVAFVRAIGVVMRRYFGATTTFRAQVTWRRRLVDTYLRAPLSFHADRPTGELMAHADIDVQAATEVLHPVPLSIGAAVIALFAVIRLIALDPLLALVGAVLFPALALMNRVYTRRVEAPAAEVQARFGDVSAVAHESFDGALVVKTLGLDQAEVERMDAAAAQLRQARLRVGRLRAGFEPGLDALPNLGVIALLALGTSRVASGGLTAGELVSAMALFGVLAFPMRVLGFLLEELPRAVVSATRLDRVLATEPSSVPDPTAVRALPAGPLPVRLRGVAFGYGDADVLEDVDVDIAAGEIVAIVGPTGAGKSTLCQLIAHLIEPRSGSVEIGGVDTRRVDPDDLRAAVALVFQESYLFADTVHENLRLDQPVAGSDLDWAVGVARASDFLGALPGQWEAVLGERGVTLSGGQRQRLALARALVRRPRLLLLDDSTSAVDPRIEQQILSGLRTNLSTTTVIVAHRVSTIALADRVVYLHRGRVRGEGTHAELMDRLPGYAALVRAYESEADEARDVEVEAV